MAPSCRWGISKEACVCGIRTTYDVTHLKYNCCDWCPVLPVYTAEDFGEMSGPGCSKALPVIKNFNKFLRKGNLRTHLAAAYNIRFAAPKVDTAINMGITTRPAVPRTWEPHG